MTLAAPRHEFYVAAGRNEPIIARGPRDGPQMLLLAPLFGEMNRTRRLLADVMRTLESRGIGSWLPDLPGTGESLTPLDQLDWRHWRDAVAAAAAKARENGPLAVASFRGGALLDDGAVADCWWRLAPVAGASLMRDLNRVRQMSDKEDGVSAKADHPDAVTEFAGYRLTALLQSGLASAVPQALTPLRSVGLDGQSGSTNGVIAGTPLWRRAEPAGSPAMSEAIAADLANWVETCAAA